jgi:hypothetical protein
MMRIAVVLSFLLAAGSAVRGGDIYRYQVERGSEMEKELGYELSVEDKHDESRATGMDEVFPIEGPAPEYSVKFRATATGKLKDLFELDLALTDANRTLLQVPLAIRSRYNKENKVDVRFLIKKDLINQAVLTVRCGGSPQGEASYAIRLGDVPVLNLPKKSLPKKSFMEAVAIAEQFLRAEKIDLSNGVLIWAEFRNYLRNEREAPRWHIAWALAGEKGVDVWVSQDGSAKLNRGRSSPRILPKKSLMEAAAIAEEFLRAQKIDISKHMLLRAEFKIYFLNERETPFWEITWGLDDQRVIAWVLQDGSAKLIRGR